MSLERTPEPGEVTRLLREVRGGNGTAIDQVMSLMYDDLRALARSQLRREYAARTLEPTTLVHEAYLKMVRGANLEAMDRGHLLALAAHAMRQVLVDYARRRGSTDGVKVRAISTVTPAYPQTTIELPNFATDSAAGEGGVPAFGFKESIAVRAYEEAGLGPDDLDCAEVYDLSTAMELDWYEQIGLCAPGEGEKLLRDGDTTIGGRIPVNASGGLACFGEAVPAQAIAQVCELVWQLRGHAGDRQVAGARVGLTVNQGLFGHGSSVIVEK